jgi:hypothetical protein
MYSVWKLGQQRMLEVYRAATLDKLAMTELRATGDESEPVASARPAVAS